MAVEKVVTIDEAIGEIDKAVKRTKDKAQAGLWEAGLKVLALAMKLAPADTGNLRASGYIRSAMGTVRPDAAGYRAEPGDETGTDRVPEIGIELGFSARYSLAVHENVEQKLKGEPRADFGSTRAGVRFGGGTGKGTYWDTGEPKFLEGPILRNWRNIIAIIKKRAGGE